MSTRWRFSHRINGRYYWTRPLPHQPGTEELCFCDTQWFWSAPQRPAWNPADKGCSCGLGGMGRRADCLAHGVTT